MAGRSVPLSIGIMVGLVIAIACVVPPAFGRKACRAGEKRATSPLSPIVLVPGTGGNQLEAKLTKDYKPGAFWLKLVYNEETQRFENFPGVVTRVPYFGSTKGMEYLDPSFRSLATYMAPLVNALEDKGFVVGETLFGAPYDFRYAPGPYASDVAKKFSKDLKELIEQVFYRNANRPVVLVAHSLGGLWVTYILNEQSPSWRTKYIKSFVSIATPWGGSVQEMLTFASGFTEGLPLIDPLVLREEQRSSETNLWLLPVPEVFGAQPLVITPSRTYTARDMEDFLTDIGYSEGVDAYKTRIPPLIGSLSAPGVPVSILFGNGMKTPERLLYYEREGFHRQPTVMDGDGDGTVNYKSLVWIVADWQKADGQKVRVKTIANKTHMSILLENDSLNHIVEEILYDWTNPTATSSYQSL